MVNLEYNSYTFNGHGEFTLMATTDSSFTLQGRMAPLRDSPQGTVLTAIAARVGIMGLRIMVDAVDNDTKVYVNDRQLVDLESVQEDIFEEFSVLLLENNTVTLRFTNGIRIECQGSMQRGFMMKVVIGVPRSFLGSVRGLLGAFNGIPGDDLLPKSSSVPIPINSDLRIIHQQFGITCK